MSLAAADAHVDNTRHARTIHSDSADTYFPTAAVRRRYGGASHMWVERRLKDDPDFPKPTYFSGRRFWRLGDLIEWERKCAARPAKKVLRGVAA
jgi:hypothetical protein